MKLPVLLGVSLLCSCENDIEKINTLSSNGEVPQLSGREMEILYSDSAKIRMKIVAPVIKQFSRSERPYLEFPEGIHVTFYGDSLKISSEIIANRAIYYTDERFWEARGNVIARNLEKAETLNTEELFWDENKKLIYSNSYSRIENADGTFNGQNGFESNERFTKWKLKGSKSTVNFRDSGNDNKNP